jgi:hypothetical protein
MTTEELLNWVLTAGLYVEASNDIAWLDTHSRTLLQCLESMERRDDPDPGKRKGVPRWDSTRCGVGREITTYDSLDASLGQASGNTYLVCKLWAASVVLVSLFEKIGAMSARERAWQHASRTALIITCAASESGRIPALLEGGSNAVILPVIEGLAYAYFGGARDILSPDGPFADFLSTLRRHMTEHVLRKDGCLYDDGGWRITSASDRTFPAKVHVCQFVARHILQLPIRDISLKADRAHALWQLHPERSAWCWTEQVVDSVMSSAKYYPRGVNSHVWLFE